MLKSDLSTAARSTVIRESLVFRRVLVSTSLWPTNTVPKFRFGAAMDRLPLCETVGWVALKPWQPNVAARARRRVIVLKRPRSFTEGLF